MSNAGKTTLRRFSMCETDKDFEIIVEIIVVDNGSTDNTYNVAREITVNSFFTIGKRKFHTK